MVNYSIIVGGPYSRSANGNGALPRSAKEVTNMNHLLTKPKAAETEDVSFPSLIKKRRTDLGMTQQELADKLKVSLSAVKSYETGRSEPPLKKLKALQAVLGLSQQEIWDEAAAPHDDTEKLRNEVLGKATRFIADKATPAHLHSIHQLVSHLAAGGAVPAAGMAPPASHIIPAAQAQAAKPEPAHPALEALATLVEERGRTSRHLPKALRAAKKEIASLDADELEDLAHDHEVRLPKLPHDPKEDKAAYQEAEDRILVAIIYGRDVLSMKPDDLNKVAEWVSSQEPPEDGWQENAKPRKDGLVFGEDEQDFRERMEKQLAPALIERAEAGEVLPEDEIKGL